MIQTRPVEPSSVRVSPDRSRVRIVAGALFALYAVWIFVMPPFAGSDEFDHAYRAAAAARGEWLITPTDATRGTGAFLHVPRDIVAAAYAECHDLRYTTARDCVGTSEGTDRIVASGAGRYHPLFYAVVGVPALPFGGATALYVMRFATALISLGFMGLALRAAGTWARTSWPLITLVAAATPVAVYSSTIVSPNGVEMMAALALWTSLLGLLRSDLAAARSLVVTAAVSGAVLATLRPLGPLWCLLIFATVLLAARSEPGRVAALIRRVDVRVGAAVVALSGLQSTVWILTARALEVGYEGPFHRTLGQRMHIASTQIPAWILQSIAAFPLRKDATHPAVYACYFFLFVALLVLGLRAGTARQRSAIVLVAAFSLLFPFATGVQGFNQHSIAWQGRYGLPLAMGMVLIAGLALDRTGRGPRGPQRVVMLLLFVLAHTISPVYTLLHEQRFSPQAGSSAWVQPPTVIAALVALVASTVMWVAASREPERKSA